MATGSKNKTKAAATTNGAPTINGVGARATEVGEANGGGGKAKASEANGGGELSPRHLISSPMALHLALHLLAHSSAQAS